MGSCGTGRTLRSGERRKQEMEKEKEARRRGEAASAGFTRQWRLWRFQFPGETLKARYLEGWLARARDPAEALGTPENGGGGGNGEEGEEATQAELYFRSFANLRDPVRPGRELSRCLSPGKGGGRPGRTFWVNAPTGPEYFPLFAVMGISAAMTLGLFGDYIMLPGLDYVFPGGF